MGGGCAPNPNAFLERAGGGRFAFAGALPILFVFFQIFFLGGLPVVLGWGVLFFFFFFLGGEVHIFSLLRGVFWRGVSFGDSGGKNFLAGKTGDSKPI